MCMCWIFGYYDGVWVWWWIFFGMICGVFCVLSVFRCFGIYVGVGCFFCMNCICLIFVICLSGDLWVVGLCVGWMCCGNCCVNLSWNELWWDWWSVVLFFVCVGWWKFFIDFGVICCMSVYYVGGVW